MDTKSLAPSDTTSEKPSQTPPVAPAPRQSRGGKKSPKIWLILGIVVVVLAAVITGVGVGVTRRAAASRTNPTPVAVTSPSPSPSGPTDDPEIMGGPGLPRSVGDPGDDCN